MRDPYTAGHETRVADLAVAIASEMGRSADEIEELRIIAVLHDLGKIYVPAEILSKPGRLTETEFELVKTHPRVGYDIMKEAALPMHIANTILQHHERVDGSGYPLGIKGNKINPDARILAVADVVEAMNSHRPYRASLGIDEALKEIRKNIGKLYDPDVVKACLKLFKDRKFVFH
jgi:putative nucleotidyltransferase with HDIG domain